VTRATATASTPESGVRARQANRRAGEQRDADRLAEACATKAVPNATVRECAPRRRERGRFHHAERQKAERREAASQE